MIPRVLRRRWTPVMAAALAATLPIGALWAGSRGSRQSPADEARAVRDYADAITPIVFDGGRVVATGIRPRLAELSLGDVTPEQFEAEADGWRASLGQVRTRLGAVPVPARLREAARLYDLALRQYVEAIDAFVDASAQPPEQVAAAITAAVPVAERADRTYDRADALVQRELARLHLPTRDELPTGTG